jgi:hypothetical protein
MSESKIPLCVSCLVELQKFRTGYFGDLYLNSWKCPKCSYERGVRVAEVGAYAIANEWTPPPKSGKFFFECLKEPPKRDQYVPDFKGGGCDGCDDCKCAGGGCDKCGHCH